jgi:GTPase
VGSLVAIVGRPNVGKSTLFNRIVGRRIALVQDIPGVTRDRHYGQAEWDGIGFTLVDTGGFLADTKDPLLSKIRDQARYAIDEADVLLFVVDGAGELTGPDQELAKLLRRSGKPVFLVANKIDSTRRETEGSLAECYALGFAEVHAVSAEHGRGVSELLDAIVKRLSRGGAPSDEAPGACRIAVVGRPNVGKSTLVNRLLGEERFVASELPGTTRDALDARLSRDGRRFVLTDTAGIRRQRSVSERLEGFAVVRSFRAIEDSDVAAVLLDPRETAVDQDAKIVALAIEKGRALLLVVSKWDLVERESHAQERYRDFVRKKLPFADFAPILFVSAKTGERVEKLLDIAWQLHEENQTRVPTSRLNDLLGAIVDAHPAPLAPGGKSVKLSYIAQVGIGPPTFAVTCNRPDAMPDSYKRFVLNRIREMTRLRVPLRLIVRGKKRRRG